MRKYFSERSRLKSGIAILLFAILSGCEKDFDEIIDVTTASYQVTGTSSFSSFRYVVGDSSLTIFLTLNSSANIRGVFCDIIASDDKKLNSNPLSLLDNGNAANGDQTAGDNTFTNLFPLSQQNPIGVYKINYYVTDNWSVTKLAAVHQFSYDNGQTNVAPVLSNIVVPDTVAREVFFVFSVTASDSNGLNDVEFVYFTLYRPDSTVVEENPGDIFFAMHDDGNFTVFGDETAGDGIYSFKNLFSQTAQTGSWRFVFGARDRGGLFSNTLEQFLIVE